MSQALTRCRMRVELLLGLLQPAHIWIMTQDPAVVLKAVRGLSEEKKRSLLSEVWLARAHAGDVAGALQFARGLTGEAAGRPRTASPAPARMCLCRLTARTL